MITWMGWISENLKSPIFLIDMQLYFGALITNMSMKIIYKSRPKWLAIFSMASHGMELIDYRVTLPTIPSHRLARERL